MAFLAAIPVATALAGATAVASVGALAVAASKKPSKTQQIQAPVGAADPAQARARELRKIQRGRVRTVLTSGQGLAGRAPAVAATAKKTILGG